MAQGKQVRNGKAFEYALAIVYAEKLRTMGIQVNLEENSSLSVARGYFEQFAEKEKSRFREAASQTFETIIRLEPGLTAQQNPSDSLLVILNSDDEGEDGDVRDVVFTQHLFQTPLTESTSKQGRK